LNEVKHDVEISISHLSPVRIEHHFKQIEQVRFLHLQCNWNKTERQFMTTAIALEKELRGLLI